MVEVDHERAEERRYIGYGEQQFMTTEWQTWWLMEEPFGWTFHCSEEQEEGRKAKKRKAGS